MQDISLLESFLLKPYEESIKNLVQGSDEYYYFMFLKLFQDKGCDLSKEQKLELSEFISRDTQLSQNIKKRKLFAQLDKYHGDSRRRRIIFGLLKELVFNEFLGEELETQMTFGFDEVSMIDEEDEALRRETELEQENQKSEEDDKQNENNVEIEQNGEPQEEIQQIEYDIQEQPESEIIQVNQNDSNIPPAIENSQEYQENLENKENAGLELQQEDLDQNSNQSEGDQRFEKFVPSQLDEKLILFETFIENVHTYDMSGISKLEPSYYNKIDFAKLLTKNFIFSIQHYLENALDLDKNQNTLKLIEFLYMKNQKRMNYFEQFFTKLNENQLEELCELNKEFQQNKLLQQEIYEKKFIQKEQLLNSNQKEQKQKLKLDGYEYLKQLPEFFKNQKIDKLNEIINYGLDEDLQISIHLIQDWLVAHHNEFKFEQQETNSQEVIYYLQKTQNFNNLRRYIEKYLQTNENLNEFTTFISQEILDQMEAETRLLKGQNVENITKVLPKDIVDQMNEQTILEIIKTNKQYFSHGEQVNIVCRIKNIQQLKVKIFQINCESYCKINKQNVQINISLDGIMPTDETDFQYPNPPIQLFQKEFRFELIEKYKQGAFIIEFQGNGMTAKALIIKGRLHIENKLTSIGHQISIMDENNEAVKGTRTGIWLDNQFYQVNQQNQIIIPFGTSSNTFNAIIVNDDYAETTTVTIEQEKYELSCSYIPNQELFVSETDSQIMLLPVLKVAQQEIDITQLKNATITVESFNKSSTSIYKHSVTAKFQQRQPLNFSFRNLSNIEETKFTLTGFVESQSEKTQIKLEHQFTIEYETENQLSKQFVQYTQENGYQILVLGRNGESYSNLIFEIKIFPIFTKDCITTKLKTNEQGIIILGQLKDVYKFTSTCELNTPQAPAVLYFQISQKIEQDQQISIQNPITTQQGNIKLFDFKVQQQEDDDYAILVFANQFIYSQDFQNEFVQRLQQQVLRRIQSPKAKVQIFNNQYQSNQRLSMEIEYVINRRSKPGYVGNTLDKPNLLLKQQFLRETTTQEEDIDNYSSANEVDDDDDRNSYRCVDEECDEAPRKEMKKKKSRKPMEAKLYKRSVQQTSGKLSKNLISEFKVSAQQNFLQMASQCFFLEKNQNDSYQVKLSNQVQQIHVIVVNKSHFNSQLYGWQAHAPVTKDISHKSNLEIGKFYSPYRESILLQEGEEHLLINVSSTNYRIIDSYQEIFEVGKFLSSEYQKNELEFYLTWNNLSLDEKLKIYNTHLCDELNLFIFFKDIPFFELYIQDYIMNKIEKSCIDYFLLQDTERLKNMVKNENFSRLSALEQCLLFVFFNEISQDKNLAQKILNYVQMQQKSFQVDKSNDKQIFDKLVGFESQEKTEYVSESDNYDRGCGGGGGREIEVCEKRMYQAECCEMACDDYCDYMEQENCEDFQYHQNIQNCKNISIQPFKNVKTTCEYCETHFQNDVEESTSHKTKFVPFLFDLIKFSQKQGLMKKGFISENFIYNYFSDSHIFKITLALLGLPQKEQSKVIQTYQEQDLKVIAQTPCVIFTKQLKELPKQLNKQVLVIQKFYDPQNRYQTCDDEQVEIELQEFEAKKIYCSELVITNCSSKRINVFLLQEIPNGAIPINSPNYSSTISISIPSYKSKSFKSEFYFPNLGQFSIYPAVVSTEKAVIAVADNYTFIVVENSQIINKENLEDIILKGSKDDILEFLKKNPSSVDDSSLEKFFKDQNFYLKCSQIVSDNLYPSYSLFKYSLYHNDLEGFKNYIQSNIIEEKLAQQFTYLKCQFIEVSIRFLEYYPILGKRVHNMSKSEQGILNVQLKEQYRSFLNYLVIKQNLSNTDKIIFCYYLLLQQRVNEAIQIFKSINLPLQKGEPILQFDYLSAYLDLYMGYPNFLTARQICEKYLSYPIIDWRNMFYEVLNMLAEYDGDEDNVNLQKTNEDQKQNYEQASKEEQLNITVENDQILLTYANLSQVTFEYYLIDLEIVFSRNPFLNDQNFQSYTYTKPLKMESYPLKNNQLQTTISFKLADELMNKNLIIIAKGQTKQQSYQYITTKLQINISENSGQLRVYDQNGKYLEKVYIKTFVQKNDGTHQFYKDGYTDLRGRFNYATLDAQSLEDVKKFAILIVSYDLGSLIKEVQPPSQLGNFEKEVKLQSKLWTGKAKLESQAQEIVYQSKRAVCKK